MFKLSFLIPILVCFSSAFGQLTLDKNFTAGVTDGDSVTYVSATQPDGKVLVGGAFELANSVARRGLARLNQDGSLDASFNPGGVGPNGSVYDIDVLSDGRMIIAGGFSTYNGVPVGRVARLQPDGTLDASFNAGGAGVQGTVNGVTIQSDSKMILSGQFGAYNGVPKFTVVRINPDGTLDTSFTSPFTSSSTFVEQTAVQQSGKIVIAGVFSISGYQNVARLNSDGALDTSFTPLSVTGSFYALALDGDDKILVGGSFNRINGATRYGMVRLSADGVIDTTFDANFLQFSTVEWFDIRPNGKIVVAGDIAQTTEVYRPIRQLNPDGTPDETFILLSADHGGYHALVLPNGQIFLTGFFKDIGTPETGHQGIVKLNVDGSVDDNFNAWLSSRGGVAGMFPQFDGKCVIAGDFYQRIGSTNRGIMRLNSDGTADTSFRSGWGFYDTFYPIYLTQSSLAFLYFAQQQDEKLLYVAPQTIVTAYDGVFSRSGIGRINYDGSPDSSFTLPLAATSINDALVQPDGKIVIAANSMGFILPASIRILIRMNPDGSIDPSFTQGTTSSIAPGYARRIIRQPDGKLIITGSFTSYLGSTRNGVVRLNENGTVDTTFTGSTGGSNARLLGLQSDGKIVYGGLTFLRRWNSDGSADATFTQGTDVNGPITAMYVQPDNKIVIGGTFTTYNGQPANRLARLNADGTLDTTAVSGLDNDPANMVSSIIPTADGHILIGGVFSNYGGIPRNNIAKLRIDDPDGTIFDYDGDGKTDFSVFRPSSGAWYLQRSTAGFQGLQFGASGDKLTPADYDGDGKTDIAVYRPGDGRWYIFNSATNTVTYPVFGLAEDVPAPGDYDGDGKADLNVFRPSQGTWYRQNSSNGTFFGMQFGQNGDVPTVGDFDGDGKNDLGIFRPSVGDWYNIRSSDGSVFGERFGQAGDKIAPADYDGDGKTDIAIYRPSTGLWVVRNSATATYDYAVFGAPADIPISGDYDGDGKADIGVWRPSDGTWYIKRSDNGQFIVFPWGQTGDVPTPSAYGN